MILKSLSENQRLVSIAKRRDGLLTQLSTTPTALFFVALLGGWIGHCWVYACGLNV